MYITDIEGGERQERTDSVVYVGEDAIKFTWEFGQNAHNYSTEVRSPLFLRPLKPCIMPLFQTAGSGGGTALEINPKAHLGLYKIIGFFNYTDDNEINISRQYNFTVELKKALAIRNIKVPEGKERIMSVDIETYIEFSELTVEFNTDGDIRVELEKISRHDLEPGSYNFKTSIFKDAVLVSEQQELGYRVIGYFDSRHVYFDDNWTMPVNIDWQTTDKMDSFVGNNSENVFCGGTILIILVIVLFTYKLLKKKNE